MSNSQQKRDYNFFSLTIDEKRSTRKKGLISVALILVYLILLAGAYLTFEYFVKAAQKQIKAHNDYLLSEEVNLKRQQAAEKNKKIYDLKMFSFSLDLTIKNIVDNDIINSNFLNLITSAIPRNLYFENITITSDQIQIQGIAPNRQLIAEYLSNMEALDLFSNIHISNITTVTATGSEGQEKTDSYSFTMSCQLKEVIEE